MPARSAASVGDGVRRVRRPIAGSAPPAERGRAAAHAYLDGGGAAASAYQRHFAATAARPLAVAGGLRRIGEAPAVAPLLALFGRVPGLAGLLARLTRIGGG